MQSPFGSLRSRRLHSLRETIAERSSDLLFRVRRREPKSGGFDRGDPQQVGAGRPRDCLFLFRAGDHFSNWRSLLPFGSKGLATDFVCGPGGNWDGHRRRWINARS